MNEESCAGANPRDGGLWAEDWFARRGWRPFEFQREVWQAMAAGESGLLAREHRLGQDLRRLVRRARPRRGVRRAARRRRRAAVRASVRPTAAGRPLADADARARRRLGAGDSDAARRARLVVVDRHAHRRHRAGRARASRTGASRTALVTTPESLSLMLTRDERARRARPRPHGDRRRVARADGIEARRPGAARAGAAEALASRPRRLGPVGDARQPRRGDAGAARP